MTKQEAISVLECMAIDMVGAIADISKSNPMDDIIRQRIKAIDIAQEALRDKIKTKDQFGSIS